MNKWFDIKELSGYINFSVGTIYNWVSHGQIPFSKVHGRLRFELEKIDNWLKENSGRSMLSKGVFDIEAKAERIVEEILRNS
jgi:excisionase family DNA binding protein